MISDGTAAHLHFTILARSHTWQNQAPDDAKQQKQHFETEEAQLAKSRMPAFLLNLLLLAIIVALMTLLTTGVANFAGAFPVLRPLMMAFAAILIAKVCLRWLKEHWPLSGFEIAQVSLLLGFVLLLGLLLFFGDWLEGLRPWMLTAIFLGLATPLVIGVLLLWGQHLRSEYELSRLLPKQ